MSPTPTDDRLGQRAQVSGFTLVEVLLALVLAAVVLTMLYGTWLGTVGSLGDLTAAARRDTDARHVLQRAARELRCSYPGRAYREPEVDAEVEPEGRALDLGQGLDLDTGTLRGTETVDVDRSEADHQGGGPTFRFELNGRPSSGGSLLSFVTTAAAGPEPGTVLSEVAYRYDRAAGTLYRRQVEPNPATVSGRAVREGDWTAVATDIRGIYVAAFDGKTWLARWSSDRLRLLPRAVRMELVVGTPERARRYQSMAWIESWAPNPDGVTDRTAKNGLEQSEDD